MTTITTTRALLEQALEALDNSVDVVYEEYTEAVQRYANIPSRKARLDRLAAMAKAHLDTSEAIRAALAAPATAPQHIDKADLCDVCREPVRHGLRHHACGEAMLRAKATAAPATAPEVAVLKSERDAAMKDAGRYRWLRDVWMDYKPAGYDGRNVGRFDLVWDYPVDDLDEAIDAAIAKAEGRKE